MAENEKQIRLRAILEEAGRQLEAEGVQYFIGVVDVKNGNAWVQSDVKGENFVHMLGMAFPTKQDAINLGIYVGTLLQGFDKKKS